MFSGDEGGPAAAHDRGTRPALKLRLPPGLQRGLLALGATILIGSAAARAEDLDHGKSAQRLFADSCATCHRSARGLAKGRFSVTLFLFLRDHYATNSSSAWALTSYLESVDGAQPSKSRAARATKPSSATRTARSSLRPPMPVPER